MDDLTHYLNLFRRRLRLRDGWRLLQRGLWLAALAALLIQLAGRAWPIERLAAWSGLPFAAWLIATVGYALFRPVSLMRAARRVDAELSLRERLSSALAFQQTLPALAPADAQVAPSSAEQAAFQRLALRQRQDALRTAAAIQPGQAFPLDWLPRPLLAAAALLALAAAAAYLPNPMDAVLAEREAVRQEAARQAERIEDLTRQIEAGGGLAPQQQEELLRQLRALAEKLRQNQGNLEQAMADLSNLEKALQERQAPNALAQQANLNALAEQLSKLAQKPRDPNQSAAAAAAQALADLAAQLPQMTPEQRQQAAEQLAQMAAQTAQTGDAALAQSLSAMAAALAAAAQQGDASQAAAQAAAQAAQGDLQQAQARLSDQQALQQALQQLQAGRQQMAQAAARSAAQAAGQPGQGQQPGQGNQPGQGQGQGQAAGGGGGSNASTLPPNTSGGRPNVHPQGHAAQAAPGALPQVYAPFQRPQASASQQLFVPGQDTGPGETTTSQGQSNLPGSANPALVPYNQVFGSYYNAAIQSLQQSYVPDTLQDYVKEYFTQLAP